MKTYYKIIIDYTQKPAGSNGRYAITGDEVLDLKTIGEVEKELENRFGNCKKVWIYRDDKDGNAQKVGRIYCHKEREYHGSKTIYWQDWVEIKEVKEETILI